MDVVTVLTRTEAFASAIEAGDREGIPSYLLQREAEHVGKVLGSLPQPIRSAEVLSVTVPENHECITLTRFNGYRGGVLLRAIWIETSQRPPVIRQAQLVDTGTTSRS
jgi:hypothetical protein